MTNPLEVICANKVRVSKKAVVEPDEEKCRYHCQGYNDACEKYYPMVVSGDNGVVGIYKC